MKWIQEGPRNARIVIVGEAPGTTEAQTGRPFVGGSGELLDRMLGRVGIKRSECFVTNVAHVQPPKNNFDWFIKPNIRPELMAGVIRLKQDIEEIKPNLIIALGARPLYFLTQRQGIEKWRGSILESTLVQGRKVIATYHPAYILRIWDYKAVAEFDLLRCAEEADTPHIILPQRDLILNPPPAERRRVMNEMLKAEWLAVDIECWEGSNGWELACVGFSDRADRALVIHNTDASALADIAELCTSPVPKVFQNGAFDTTVLANHGITVVGFEWDTMLAHHALYPECASGADEISVLGGRKRQSAIAKGLAFQTSIYTREPYYKDDGKLWKKTNDLQMFWRYNALDAAVTREIRDVQQRELAAFGTERVLRHEMSVLRPLMEATNRGIRIDLLYRAQLKAELEREITNLQNFLDQACGTAINVKSPKQVQSLLYDTLKLPVKRNRKTGNPSADKDAIIELAGKSNNPVLHVILKIRQRRDYVERYLDAPVDADGRMRCSFDVTGTRSGRLSSRQSIYGSGTNLQNIPARKPEGEKVRRMFVADVGKAFVYRDFSQAEARVVACLARCDRLIELFEDPSRDVHTENASRIFNKPLDEITPEERYQAKRVVHASNYGMGPDRLVQLVNEDAETTGVRLDHGQAKDLIDRYFMLYPEIREIFWRGVEQELRASRTLNTPFGRKRAFYGRWDDKLLREAYSYIPQSTVGDLCNLAVVRVDAALREIPGAEFLLAVHDSILVQCNIQDVERVADRMARAMDIPIAIEGRTLTIPTDCKVGLNWGTRPKKSPESNPQGLVDIEVWLRENANGTET